VAFFHLLPLIDGEHAGEPFDLLPWMEHEIVRPLFGWMRADGTRLYREAYLRVARKNAKSTLCAGIAGKLTFADGESGARVYAAAVDRDQAKEVFETYKDMIVSSRSMNPTQNRRVKVLQRSIIYQPKDLEGAPARFRILSGETKNKDGLNISGGIIDELHAHPTREMYDLLNQGTASRRQPLIFSISTAGVYSKDSVCVERDRYTRQVAERQIKDPAFLGVIYALDEGDDWRDEDVWIKANPGLGVTIPLEFLRRECAKAESSPAAQNAFRTKHMNEWTQQTIRWIDLGTWDSSAGLLDEVGLATKPCFGGLHIGSSTGLAAWVLVFPDGEGVRVLPRFFIPAESVSTDPQMREWAERGLVNVTDGDVTDYAFIREQIVADAGKYELRGMNVSIVYRGSGLAQDLVELFGVNAVQWFRTTFPGFALSTREFDRMLVAKLITHGGNAVLRQQADDVAVRRNVDGDVRPDTEASQGPISGIVAMLMALDLHLLDEGPAEPMVTWA
jgi:phage terminase large subunit-like protein